MPRIERLWATITYVFSFLTLSPLRGLGGEEQAPLTFSSADAPYDQDLRGPIFKPPGGSFDSDFVCDYSAMPDFHSCSTPEDRSCWLRNNKTGFRYDIHTDYEDLAPKGVLREYSLTLYDDSLNADGIDFPFAKLFDHVYPGPWIQACWGDTVSITVYNMLSHNGTSIHWHGIRQWLSMQMDGVPGVTQCPIAPCDSFKYTWKAMQYGSSWYHSHYSVQYADGAVGPMTLHGPSSAPYDEPKAPLLMTDWGHNSAFEAIQTNSLKAPSILLNGRGNVTQYNPSVHATLPIPEPYTIHFDRPKPPFRAKRYLLRLINTSFESTFIFSIDNHLLEIVGADFVPITPYKNTSVLVGIGQRYHVIVTAKDPLNADGNYWIRTYRANCFNFPKGKDGYEKTGILRYSDSKARPTTQPWVFPQNCSDEAYANLKPILPWKVGPAANNPLSEGQNLTVQFKPGQNTIYPLAKFTLKGPDFNPLRINYGDPTFLHLNYTGKWNPLWVVLPESFYSDDDWVYLVLKGVPGSSTGAHPIHLHGHDFAILQQIANATFPDKLNLTFDNPPRRDVVLLPSDGYVVIAFKTDNPGTWLMHCHIAYHASFGLALQIIERQKDAAKLWPDVHKSPALRDAQTLCNNWNKWWGDCRNWWPGDGSSCLLGDSGFAPDSGI